MGESPGPPRPAADVAGLDVVVSVLVGMNFAVASPVLDYLGRNPDVFTVRDAPRADVGGVLVLLTLGLPLAVALLTRAAYGVWRRLGVAVHGLLLAGLLTSFVAQLLDRLTPLSAWPAAGLLALAAALAVPPTIAYFRNRELRKLVRFAVVAPLAFAALFAFATPTGALLSAEEAAEEATIAVGNPVPVVMVVFDALPVVSLMDEQEQIDAELFPSFARLAADATWFRNATTHSPKTRVTVPTMLTGEYPEGNESLSVSDFPRNAFTVLAEQYRMVAYEPMTALCPASHCARVERQATTQERWARLSRDVSVLGLHAVLPQSLHDRLPPAEQALGDFAGATSMDWTDEDLAEEEAWERFLVELRPDARPGLHVFHWLKPHFPWHGLPSGQESLPPLSEPHRRYGGHVWADDSVRVAQWQRQLLQVGYVDRRLGELLDALEDVGVYDEALVIVASDHGEAFVVGQPTRIPADETLGDIAFATLLVKPPGQQRARVVDDPVELVDVFPTVLDVLDVEPASETDGSSLLGPRPAERERSIAGWGYRGSIGSDAAELRAALVRKLEQFGSQGGWERLFRAGPHGELVGRSVDEVGVDGEAATRVRVDLPSRLADVDLAAARLPTVLSGSISAGEHLDPSTPLALAVNGRIATVVGPHDVDGSSARFFGVVPRDALAAGRNTLEVYEVRTGADGPGLWSLPER